MAQVLQFQRQRRAQVRVPVCQPVGLVHENSTVVTAMATNLSARGAQVVCKRIAADALCEERRRFSAAAGPRIGMHFMLPLGVGLARLDIEARLVYVQDISRNQVQLGLEFLDYHHDSRSHLHTFLREAEQLA